ncbi:MAG: cytochrome b [Betaproteobacteria bacterium]
MRRADQPPLPSYDWFSRALHWIAAVLIVLAWALMEMEDLFPKGSEGRRMMKLLHYDIGLLALLLFVPRLPWRWLHPVAELDVTRWMKRIATLTKVALYLLMVLVPLSGLAVLQAKGEAVALLGLSLPDLFSGLAPYRKAVKEVHETLSNVLLVLVFAHAAAALWHHYVLRDVTLRRMLGRT